MFIFIENEEVKVERKNGLIEFVALTIVEMYHKELKLSKNKKNDVATLVQRILLKTEDDIDIFHLTDFIAINLKKVYNLSIWEIISKYYETRIWLWKNGLKKK